MNSNLGSIIVPCYNEELRFNLHYFQNLNNKLQNSGLELVFVNDGSTDKTLEILKQISFNPRIINLPKNVGKAEAIRKAMLEEIKIEEKVIFGYLDSDSAFDTDDISRFISDFLSEKALQPYQILSAARVKLAGRSINRRTHRHLIGRLISSILNLGFKNKIYDPQSGFKLYRKSESLVEAFLSPFATRWFIDIEIITHFNHYDNAIIELPVNSWVDTPGSKIVAKEYLRIIIELIKIIYIISNRNNLSGFKRK